MQRDPDSTYIDDQGKTPTTVYWRNARKPAYVFLVILPRDGGMYVEDSYQYQNAYKADLISSYKEEKYNIGKRGVFHGRFGFMFKFC